MKKLLSLAVGILMLAAVQNAESQSLESFEKNVTEFTLENGLTFIIIKRDVAPVVSFMTYVNVGSANEPVGQTGIAHIFEHMAFKGTSYLGTTNYEEEKPLIEAVDDAYRQWLHEKIKTNHDEEKLADLWETFQELEEKAKKYVVNNEFSTILDQEGAVGLNAFTSADATGYFYSLPSNKVELWFTLESDRFLDPVFREFYVEKDVIYEERRMRTDSSPFGRLLEEFLSVAFSAHPYKNPVIGWPSDIMATTIRETREFYERFYVPSNITIAIAGDVDPAEMKRLAELYFGRMPASEPAPILTVIEPPQRGERRFIIEEESQPIFLKGYKTVANDHADAKALQLTASILFQGRTSRLFRRMVTDEKMALAVTGINGFPGSRYPGLFIIYAFPNQGVSLDLIEATIEEEIAKIKNGEVEQHELDRVRTQVRASLVRSLANNTGLTFNFAGTHAVTGDWRNVFRDIDRLNDITLDDIQRVANTYFFKENRTVGMIRTKSEGDEVAEANQ
ncbi:MAG: insulinase family protein [Balneolaceae bacterium]|nr:MAG: insulinase family protein [Balneolaceae bacterium]